MAMEVLGANRDRARPFCRSSGAHTDLLRISDLSVDFHQGPDAESRVLRQVTFTIGYGEIAGLFGESGSGKTTAALALMQLLPPSAQVTGGSIEFLGRNLLNLDARRLREIRGAEMSIIYQDSTALNPVMRVGDQVMEVLRAHRAMPPAQMRDEVYSMFSALRLKDCDRLFRAYPHQLSGGQRRRIAIAQALVCKPRLVIADEPTTALDAPTAADILSVFKQARDLYGTSFLLISHDPEALSIADRILVMYAGQIVEQGTLSDTIGQPKHPYTAALLRCRTFEKSRQGRGEYRLPCIPGTAPDPSQTLRGCSFSARCADRMECCDEQQPELVGISATQSVRCVKFEEGIGRA